MTKTISLVLEGLPGSGKTTTMVTLARLFGDACLIYPKINPTFELHKYVSELSELERAEWYLAQEIRNCESAHKFRQKSHFDLIIFDKCYLSVLAYCYARSSTQNDLAFYEQVLCFFNEYIIPKLYQPDWIMLSRTLPTISLSRRIDKPKLQTEGHWYDLAFLKGLYDFYTQELPHIDTISSSIFDITHLHLKSLLTSIGTWSQGVIDIEHLQKTLIYSSTEANSEINYNLCKDERFFPQTHIRVDDDAIWDYYQKHGGHHIFGQPMSELLWYLDRPVQFFERQALFKEIDGTISYWSPEMVDI